MQGFFGSPFSVPVAGIACGAIAILVSAWVKVSKMKYSNNDVINSLESDFRIEISNLKGRIEALESIVVNMDKRFD